MHPHYDFPEIPPAKKMNVFYNRIWFSLDHKRNVSDGVISRIEMLFHLIISSTLLITTPTLSLVKTSL